MNVFPFRISQTEIYFSFFAQHKFASNQSKKSVAKIQRTVIQSQCPIDNAFYVSIQSFPERFPSLRTPNLPPTLTAKQLEKALKNETEEAADEETVHNCLNCCAKFLSFSQVDSATESNSFNSVSSNQTSSFSSQTNSTDSGRGIVTLLEKLRNSNRRATTLRGVKKPTLSVVLAQESFQPGETGRNQLHWVDLIRFVVVSGFLSLELPKNHMVKACYASFVTRGLIQTYNF